MTRKSPVGLCWMLVFLVGMTSPMTAFAQETPWCESDGLDKNGDPYPPRPYWSQIQTVPNYEEVMSNFNLMESLTLLISMLEKGITKLEGELESQAGVADADGTCVCNCDKTANEWVTFLGTTIEGNLESAIEQTKEDYIATLKEKLVTLRDLIVTTPADLETTLLDLVEAECQPGGTLAGLCELNGQSITDFAQGVVDTAANEITTIFNAEQTQAQNALQNVADTGLQQLESQATDLGQMALDSLQTQDFGSLADQLSVLLDTVEDTANSLVDTGSSIATNAEGSVPAWMDQVWAAVETYVNDNSPNPEQALTLLQTTLETFIESRIEAIQTAMNEVVQEALDVSGAIDTFVNYVQTGVVADLSEVEGCYGTTKRAECTQEAGGYCEGATGSTSFAGVEFPIWFPTGVFKDGKTAALFAIEQIGFLEQILDWLQNTLASDVIDIAGNLIDALENAQEVLETLTEYVDRFTDGYHLGTYSQVRPDLHACVGYGGHNAFAPVFAFNVGNNTVSGGTNYKSFNLSQKHRAQFRSGGFALDINGSALQLAPGVSLNTQMDGFRLWDANCPFGIGCGDSAQYMTGNFLTDAEVDKFDVFNLVEPSQLQTLCNSPSPGCAIYPTSMLYDPAFPVLYNVGANQYSWPRSGLGWESNLPSTAVFGAGLNLELLTKKYTWDLPPGGIPIYPPFASLYPWFSIQAGVHWVYEANWQRDALAVSINMNLPVGEQLVEADFHRDKSPTTSPLLNGERFQAPDVTEDVGHGAGIYPDIGAQLDIGFSIGKWFKIGVFANLGVGLDVDVDGSGGLLDMNRVLVDALESSDPPGEDCEAVWGTTITTRCSNTAFQPNVPCGTDTPCATNADCHPSQICEEDAEGALTCGPDCINVNDSEAPAFTGVPSTGDYACGESEGDACAEFGYCRNADGEILAHDVTQEECEAPLGPEGSCVAVHMQGGNPCECGEGCSLPIAKNGSIPAQNPPSSMCFQSAEADASIAYQAGQVLLAQEFADKFLTEEGCVAWGWCMNWVLNSSLEPSAPSALSDLYVAGFIDAAEGQENCPPVTDGNGDVFVYDGTLQPVESQYWGFEWQPDPSFDGVVGLAGTWFSYECADTTHSEVTGWVGPDCSPLAVGFPSACGCYANNNCAGSCSGAVCSELGANPCSCDPQQGGTCPGGRICQQGACVLTCSTDADCGDYRVCEDGGCYMDNGVPFAEQLVWSIQNVDDPKHTVASYALQRLTVASALDASVTIGMEYKLFRKWKEKVLWSWSDVFPLLEILKVKHQLGLAVDYQDDCDILVSSVENLQPERVTRPLTVANGATAEELIDWCMGTMTTDADNPDPQVDPGTTLGGSLDDVLDFGEDVTTDLWAMNQVCIDGVLIWEYFGNLAENPDAMWSLLECTYEVGGQAVDVPCTTPDELYLNMLFPLGCMHLAGPNVPGENADLLTAFTAQGGTGAFFTTYEPTVLGVPTGASETVINPFAFLIDAYADDLFAADNIAPVVQSFSGGGSPFDYDLWLTQINACIEDVADGGQFDENLLAMTLPLSDEDVEACNPCEDGVSPLGPCPDAPITGTCCTADGECLISTETICVEALGGVFTAGTICAGKPTPGQLIPPNAISCPSVDGACCLPYGDCATLAEAPCAAAGGSFDASASCTEPWLCSGPPAQACCIPGGGCTDADETDCGAAGGTWSSGFSCDDPGTCEGTESEGACCLANGTCLETSQEVCEAGTGSFQTGADCGDPIATCGEVDFDACCIADGCQMMTGFDCVSSGGSHVPWQACGDPGVCSDEPVLGACCLGEGECVMEQAQICLAQGFSWDAFGTCDDPGICTTPCEGGFSGGCKDVDYSSQCDPSNPSCGAGAIPGDSNCDGQHDVCMVCPEGTAPADTTGDGCEDTCACFGETFPGACCYADGCVESDVAECVANQGVWNTGASCSDPDFSCFPAEVGACCAGFACEMLTEEDCLAESGTWNQGGDCADPNFSCIEEPENGACCLPAGCWVIPWYCGTDTPPDTPQCQVVPQEPCLESGGTWNAGEACSVELCESDPSDECCLPKSGGQCVPFGDVTLDGKSNVVDVQCSILTALASLTGDLYTKKPGCMSAPIVNSDLNCDAGVDITDVLLYIQLALEQPMDSSMDADGDSCPDACKGD